MSEKEESVFEMTVGRCETDGAVGETVYGIRATTGAHVWQFDDVDASPQPVERLLCRLWQGQPEPCHLEDIVRDFVDRDGE